ncbi:hypothetical protein [Sulfidibacter corallicola]|uniref:TRASH domain-containing protein n=1 Tax=Sulfidibacter corallicola TaxID=2818388 RepID=A0A8A4TGX7_SULCO|nr:hypothetical protein [Sulfidibacter corallicola]QTD49176.1 hypothetical protein J3U87_26620 [Sulfidibacter corallicola]
MVLLIAFVAFLVAATYIINSTNPEKRKYKSFSGGGDNPFRGRYTKPPKRTSNKTIDKGSMIRCHNCACFFPETRVVNEVVEGHILEFCSESCRHNFHLPRQ